MLAKFNTPERACKRCGKTQNKDQFAMCGEVCITCKATSKARWLDVVLVKVPKDEYPLWLEFQNQRRDPLNDNKTSAHELSRA